MTTITIKQGTDSGIRWLVNDGATGLPFDFSGWTARSQVRRAVNAGTVLHEWSTALFNATTGADGYITITWSAAETSAWDFSSGVYDLEIIDPTGKVIRLDAGRVVVSAEVTKP